MNPLSLLSLGNSVGGIFGTLFGGKEALSDRQQQLADAINPVDATFTMSPEVKQQLGLATQLENGAAPGTATQTNNIFTNQSNTVGANNNNATSGAQALAVNAATQGQTNKAVSGVQTENENNKVAMLGNLNNATSATANQEQQVYQDQVRKFNNDTAAKAALQSAAIQNKASWNNDLSSLVGNLFSKKSGAGGSSDSSPLQQLMALFSGGGSSGGSQFNLSQSDPIGTALP